ncbi:MAG: acetyl-CoA carboxylase biotin carboxyl carrier protein [Candidatus Solibacter sp.]|nr:acetyl-CoA carboxylase biotin carboxyl carrier protein [Candidatus Solibacter sp.]
MTIEEIQDLIHTVVASGIAELEVQRGENRVWIKRHGGVTQEIMIPAPAPAPAVHVAPPVQAAPAAASSTGSGGGLGDLTDPALLTVTSPIVGTFYESPSPGSQAFIQPGDRIQPGKVLCVIESMKLMNEIESEISGAVVKRLVDNGQPVEYGEALFLVKPN